MYFRILNNEVTGELSYLLADEVRGEAVLVDPHGPDLVLWQALLGERDLRLRWVLRTHHHDALRPGELTALQRLGSPLVQGDMLTSMNLSEGSLLPFGREQVRILATPGHTPHCLSYAWNDRVFCGGLLAVSACPVQSVPVDPEALWDSVTRKILTLPDETLLFAGHEQRARAVSTVLEQRRWHPLFAGLTRDEFLAHWRVQRDVATGTMVF
ncbi:MAG: MBL fold metallo-hydrolase [Rhodoferax sp.]